MLPTPLQRKSTADPKLLKQLSFIKEDSGSSTNRSLAGDSSGELVILHA